MGTLRQQIATNVLTVTRFRDLMKKLEANRPNDDLEIVRKAYEFSQKVHAGQSRASGQPYLVHPLEVACVLAEMKMDLISIAAGLLHDSVEDTSVTIVEIRREFGEQVAHIVEGVTKISKIDFASHEQQQAENLRKMMLAMVDDIRVVLIKLADRLHNMRTLEHLPAERQHKIARETLDIYAPIAHRLGMGKIRGELEDLGFRYLDPIAYQTTHDAFEARRKEARSFWQAWNQFCETNFKRPASPPMSRAASSVSTAFTRSSCVSESPWNRFMTFAPCAWSRVPFRIVTLSSASFTTYGGRFPDASKISSPCRGRTFTSRCTPPSSRKTARPSKYRFAPKKCTKWRKKALLPTGNTRMAPSRHRTSSAWHGCARSSSGNVMFPIPMNF